MGASLIIPTIILFVALLTDIKTRKIPNVWIIVSVVLALANSYYFYEFDGLKQGAQAAGLALALTLPLVLIGALGAGDMKLMFAFGMATTYSSVFSVLVFSFIWAAIVGVAFAIFKGQGAALFKNTIRVVTSNKDSTPELQKIPYTIALALAWLTYIAIGYQQGAL